MSHRIPPNFQPHDRPPSIATLRLIVTALIAGACVFGGTVAFSASRIGAKVINEPVIISLFAGVAAIAAVVVLVLPKFMPPLPGQNESQQLRRFGTLTLCRIGLLEAAAVLNYIVYLISQNEITLCAGIVMVLLMLALRPSQSTFETWRTELT